MYIPWVDNDTCLHIQLSVESFLLRSYNHENGQLAVCVMAR